LRPLEIFAAEPELPWDSATQVTITVEGPWAYTTNDVNHPGKLVLIAPHDQKGHNDPEIHHLGGWLTVTALPSEPEIALEKYVAPGQSQCDTGAWFPPLKQNAFNGALSTKNNRFVVVLPLPDSCSDYESYKSKISPIWFGDPHLPSVEHEAAFPTMIELTYTVSSKTKFSVDGGKNYNFDLLGGHELQIRMEPNGKIKHDKCDNDSRHAFYMLVKLFRDIDSSFTYYEDFPQSDGSYNAACWKSDEQNPHHLSGREDRSLVSNGSGACRKTLVRLNLLP
jgi:hypothetical protein